MSNLSNRSHGSQKSKRCQVYSSTLSLFLKAYTLVIRFLGFAGESPITVEASSVIAKGQQRYQRLQHAEQSSIPRDGRARSSQANARKDCLHAPKEPTAGYRRGFKKCQHPGPILSIAVISYASQNAGSDLGPEALQRSSVQTQKRKASSLPAPVFVYATSVPVFTGNPNKL